MKGTIGLGKIEHSSCSCSFARIHATSGDDLKSAFLSHAEGENKYSPENFKLPQANKVTAFKKKSKAKKPLSLKKVQLIKIVRK